MPVLPYELESRAGVRKSKGKGGFLQVATQKNNSHMLSGHSAILDLRFAGGLWYSRLHFRT